MRNFHTILLTILLCIACDSEESSEPEAVAAVQEDLTEVAETETEGEPPPDPCTLLTEDMVREHLELAEDVEIEQSRSKHSPHPLCSYSWNTLSEEEQKEARAKMVKNMMEKVKKGKTAGGLMDMATSMGNEEAHLTVFKEAFDSPEQARQRLESIRARMEKGIKQDVRGETVEFQSSYQTVEGVGNEAYWSPKHNQLSVAQGDRIFHLGVKARDESRNLELSKELARRVADEL